MTKKLLSNEQIEEAKSLRETDSRYWTKRRLSLKYEVGQTTIWENVFSNRKRVRIYTYNNQPKIPKEFCTRCELVITRTIKGNFVPFNFKIGDKCISCYLEERGFTFLDIPNI